MARSAESILEDIYDELKKNNKNSGVNDKSYDDLLTELKRNRNSSSGADSNREDSSDNKKNNSVMKSIRNYADNLGMTIGKVGSDIKTLTDFDASPARRLKAGLDVLGDSLNVIPLIGSTLSSIFNSITKVATGIYDIVNGWYEQYSKYNMSGLFSVDGMIGLQKALGSTMLSFDEFSSIVSANSKAFASFGGRSAEVFTAHFNSLVNSQSEFGQLNMSMHQMGDIIASNIKNLKTQGLYDKISETSRRDSERVYADNLNEFSKILGISTDEINKKVNGDQGLIDQTSLQATLMGRGLSQKAAAASAKNVEMLSAAMGKTGELFAGAMTEYASRGVIGDMSGLGKTMIDVGDTALRGILSNMGSQLLKKGYTNEQATDQMLNQIFANKDNIVQQLAREIDIAARNFGSGSEQVRNLSQIMNDIQTMADPAQVKKDIEKAKKNSSIDRFVNNVNLGIRNIGSALNTRMYTGLENATKTLDPIMAQFSSAISGNGSFGDAFKTLMDNKEQLVRDIFGDELAAWILGDDKTFEQFNKGFKGLTSINIESVINSILPEWLANAITKPEKSVSSELAAKMPTMRDILKGLGMRDWLIDILTDENSAKSTQVQEAVNDGLAHQINSINDLNKNTNTFMGRLNEAVEAHSKALGTINDKSGTLNAALSKPFNFDASKIASVPNGTPWQVQPEQTNVLPLPSTILPSNASNTGTIYQQNMVTNQLVENTKKTNDLLTKLADTQDKMHNTFQYVRTYN